MHSGGKYTFIGNGACRNEGGTYPRWYRNTGTESSSACEKICDDLVPCVAYRFDDRNDKKCTVYGNSLSNDPGAKSLLRGWQESSSNSGSDVITTTDFTTAEVCSSCSQCYAKNRNRIAATKTSTAITTLHLATAYRFIGHGQCRDQNMAVPKQYTYGGGGFDSKAACEKMCDDLLQLCVGYWFRYIGNASTGFAGKKVDCNVLGNNLPGTGNGANLLQFWRDNLFYTGSDEITQVYTSASSKWDSETDKTYECYAKTRNGQAAVTTTSSTKATLPTTSFAPTQRAPTYTLIGKGKCVIGKGPDVQVPKSYNGEGVGDAAACKKVCDKLRACIAFAYDSRSYRRKCFLYGNALPDLRSDFSFGIWWVLDPGMCTLSLDHCDAIKGVKEIDDYVCFAKDRDTGITATPQTFAKPTSAVLPGMGVTTIASGKGTGHSSSQQQAVGPANTSASAASARPAAIATVTVPLTTKGPGTNSTAASKQVNGDGEGKDRASVLPTVIAIGGTLVVVCVCLGAVWTVYFRKRSPDQITKAAATTVNVAYDVAAAKHQPARRDASRTPIDDVGYLMPTLPCTPRPGGSSTDGYALPDQVPAAAGYVRPTEDPYGLDARLIRVDQNQQLGKGNYGVVYRGTMECGGSAASTVGTSGNQYELQGAPSTIVDVAIKMLPQDRAVHERERQDFWEEIKFLRQLQCLGGHENVIEFTGYVAGEEMMLLLEFAPGGSLLGYLRKRDRGDSLPELEAVAYAAQIASGMRYIADNRMVHRDLAARNVLLSAVRVCKITDFGLARDVYNDAGQYQANVGYKTSNPTAYKWTALEGLTQSVFTIEGDVWSFAIVLSEICSLGNNPYVEHRSLTGDFLDYLTSGGRMRQGAHWSSPFLYAVMQSCWDENPAKRPSFDHLAKQLITEKERLETSPEPHVAHIVYERPNPVSDDGYEMPEGLGVERGTDYAVPTSGSGAYASNPTMAPATAAAKTVHVRRTRHAIGSAQAAGTTDDHDPSEYHLAQREAHQPAPGTPGREARPPALDAAALSAQGTGPEKKSKKPQRGKQRSVYLGFADGGDGADGSAATEA